MLRMIRLSGFKASPSPASLHAPAYCRHVQPPGRGHHLPSAGLGPCCCLVTQPCPVPLHMLHHREQGLRHSV
jgi:hypothetical protein